MLFARCTGRRDSGPGPGAYETRLRNSGPQFTIKGRYVTKRSPSTAPYRSIPTTVGEGPKYSLSSRTGTRIIQGTPGPNYVPSPLGSDAKKISISYRHGQYRDSRIDNPGPGAYDVRPQFANDAPKSTLHSRTKRIELGASSPGPAAYLPNDELTRKRAPSASIHIRTRVPGPEATPGYYYNGSTLSGPKFTIGRREELDLVAI